jgi:hypothetical protein
MKLQFLSLCPKTPDPTANYSEKRILKAKPLSQDAEPYLPKILRTKI